jgi:hypothetical protein
MTAKRLLLESALAHGLVKIILDATAPGVRVPAEHARDRRLVLDLSHAFGPRYPIALDDDGIHARLSFSGRACDAEIPWAAIGGMVIDGELVLFPASMPVLAGGNEAAPRPGLLERLKDRARSLAPFASPPPEILTPAKDWRAPQPSHAESSLRLIRGGRDDVRGDDGQGPEAA